MDYMELCNVLRARCKKEAPNLEALKTLFNENPRLAQLTADIDDIITQWALQEIRKMKDK